MRIEAALFQIESVHHIHGDQCLCGFKSSVSRDRTKHIMEVTLEAAAPGIRSWALENAAAAAEGMHDPTPPDCQEWADWLRARAAAERAHPALADPEGLALVKAIHDRKSEGK
jgi:hypothetical protein